MKNDSDPIPLRVTHAAPGRTFLVATACGARDAAGAATSVYEQIALTLAEARLDIVHERVFASLSAVEDVLAARARVFAEHDISPSTPVTCIEGRSPWGDGLAGVIVSAVRRAGGAADVRTLLDDGRPCGRVWRRGATTQVVLQNITGHGHDAADSRASQVAGTIERADRLLREAGLSYRDVARTWFYISDILDWYAEFNRARTASYQKLGVLPLAGGEPVVLPASTGIGARAPGEPAVCLDLIAVSGTAAAPASITRLSNPGQPEALAYGSAFARGVLVRAADLSLIELSGTAAVDEVGRSLFPGDARAQILCTFEKAAVLLGQANADLHDIVAATAFVKNPGDAAVFREVVGTLGLADLPAVCMVADICRPELLFELDAEVRVPGGADRV